MMTATTSGAPSLVLDSDELARDYERISATRQFLSGKRLVGDLAIAAGERVLDVGCGTGLLAGHIADLVGPAGRVLGIDPLPLRIEIAQARARANLEFRVGDAYDLGGLPDSGFDVVCLNAVFHWLPEKTGPLREFARLLRPGGRLGISSGLKGERSRLQEIVAEVLAEPPFDRDRQARDSIIFRVDADEMRALLEATGFVPALIEVRTNEQVYPSAEAAIRFSEASSFGNFMGHLPSELRQQARAVVARRLAAVAGPEGIVRRGQRLIALAAKR
jgi:arsenite methyltransferase